MNRGKARLVAILIGAPVTLLALIWIGVELKGPNAEEAALDLPDSGVALIVRLEANHPFLAEYRRFVIVRRKNADVARIEMMPDSGGYARTQLYRFPDGRILIQGYFDAANLDQRNQGITRVLDAETSGGVYFGAFDRDKNRNWKFMTPKESAEQQLVAGGG